MTRTGVVTIAHGRHDHLRRQQATLTAQTVHADVIVVVAIDDPAIADLVPMSPPDVHVVPVASDPRGLPLAAARNRGIEEALAAGCDVVVGLDVDCLAGRDLVADYTTAVQEVPSVVWSGPVTYLDPPDEDGYPLGQLELLDDPHPARPAPQPGERVAGAEPDLFWSLSFAVSAHAWRSVGGFDEAYVGYGAEDTDFGRRVAAAGLGLGWTGGARAYHQHHPVEDPPVRHLDDILRNGRVFADRWGQWPMAGWIADFERRGLVRRTADGWVRADRDEPGVAQSSGSDSTSKNSW